jgi:hypothetical protein
MLKSLVLAGGTLLLFACAPAPVPPPPVAQSQPIIIPPPPPPPPPMVAPTVPAVYAPAYQGPRRYTRKRIHRYNRYGYVQKTQAPRSHRRMVYRNGKMHSVVVRHPVKPRSSAK